MEQDLTDRAARIATARAFFAPRAATWEQRFPDDDPAYEWAVAELAPPAGGVALDAGCGTGRALPALRRAVGPTGTVLALDVTEEMLAQVVGRGRDRVAVPVLADVVTLPLATAAVDAIFASGLTPHLDDPAGGLRELARVCRPGGRLALFHPIGRVALARKRGQEPRYDDIRAEPRIRALLAAAGWRPESVDDADDRYLALAVRTDEDVR